MRAFIIVAVFFITVDLFLTAVNYIGDNYSDIFGPALLLGLVAILIRGLVRSIKRGK